MNQPSLFDDPVRLMRAAAGLDPDINSITGAREYPHTPGYVNRDTSKAAANLIEPKASALRLRMLSEIQIRGTFGATCDELEQAFGMSHQTVSARCRELNMTGKTKDSGQRRPTRTGRKAIVWVAKEGQR